MHGTNQFTHLGSSLGDKLPLLFLDSRNYAIFLDLNENWLLVCEFDLRATRLLSRMFCCCVQRYWQKICWTKNTINAVTNYFKK